MNRFWVVLSIVVVGLIAAFVFTGKDKNQQSAFNGDASKIQEEDHIIKAPNEKVVLIEYGDYQCPACGAAYAPIKAATEQLKDQVTFVFRNLPLTSLHPNAFAAARAAEAAAKQGKFWEMHDRLYETQDSWGNVTTNQQSLFEGYAQELGLKMDQFKTDYASEETANRINRDVSSAKSGFDATGTPTLVLNGKKIENPASTTDAYVKALTEAITKAGGTAPAAQ